MEIMQIFDSAIERATRGLLERDLPADAESVASAVANGIYHFLIERAEIVQAQAVENILSKYKEKSS